MCGRGHRFCPGRETKSHGQGEGEETAKWVHLVEKDPQVPGSARIQVTPGGEGSSSTWKCQDTGNTRWRRILKYLKVPGYWQHLVEEYPQVLAWQCLESFSP